MTCKKHGMLWCSICDGKERVMSRATEIKAALYELQGHTCNSRLTLTKDGGPDPGDKPCEWCAKTMRLHAELRTIEHERKKP